MSGGFGRGRGSRGRRKGFGDNGFAEWGGYMAAKKAKLEDQFSADAAKESDFHSDDIFKNVAVFVDGYTDPSADEIKRIMMVHGGTFHTYLSHKTTHIIAKNLPDTKVKCLKGNEPICRANWITDSLKAGKLLDYRNYLLYSNQSSSQPKISFEQTSKGAAKPSTVASGATDPKNLKNALDAKDDNFIGEFYNNSRLHHISTMGANFKKYVSELRSKESNFLFPEREKLRCCKPSNKVSNSKENDVGHKVFMHIDMDCFFVSVGLRNKPEYRGLPVVVTHSKGKTGAITSNAEVVRKEAEIYEARHSGVGQNCSTKTSSLLGAAGITKDDTFTSMAEIASCSYEARKYGVRNGMFMGTALKLCPDLKTISYDFEGYQEVAKSLYDTVSKYTLEIQAVSCDEMLVDLTEITEDCNISPKEFSKILRDEIFEATGCTASVGLGPNMLLARLATRKAKPDGIFAVQTDDAQEFMRAVSVQELPGVGKMMSKTFQSLGIAVCSDLQRLSLDRLLREFGPKSGQSLFEFCRGIDHRQLNVEQDRKSVSAEINYGIRFETDKDAQKFLGQLSEEVHQRMLKLGNVRGRSIQLKVMVRAKEASKETAKFMGHGICDNFSRSVNLLTPTNDSIVIQREAWHLLKQLNADPKDLRGIGIQVSKLENHCESGFRTSNAPSILNFVKKLDKGGPIPNTEPSSSLSSITISKQNGDSERENGPNYGQTSYGIVNQLPSFSCIDPDVLDELPEDVRSELLEFYNVKPEEKLPRPQSPGDRIGFVPSTSRGPGPVVPTYDDLSFSQLDPSVIAELPPEIVAEVKEHLVKKPPPKVVKSAFDQLRRVPLSSPDNIIKRRGRPPKTSPCHNKVSKKPRKSPTKAKAKRVLFNAIPRTNDDPEVCAEVAAVKECPIPPKPPATLEGRRSIGDLRALFREWIKSTNEPTYDDAETVSTFLKEVVDEKDLDLVLKSLHRQCYSILGKRSYNYWTQCYENIKLEVNMYVQHCFGCMLFTDFKT